MTLKTLFSSKYLFLWISVLIEFLLVLVIVLLWCLPLENKKTNTMDNINTTNEYIKTEYGFFNTSIPIVHLATPESFGVQWMVIVVFSNSGVVYRYFETEEDAWGFYTMIRMLYGGLE